MASDLAPGHLIVAEGQSIHDVLFRLPDFGPKRRLQILVASEDGVPVAGAHDLTDAAGQVILNLWRAGDYRLMATLWGNQESWSSDPVTILPGQSDLSRTIVLKSLRLKPR